MRDIGRELNTAAHMSELQRLKQVHFCSFFPSLACLHLFVTNYLSVKVVYPSLSPVCASAEAVFYRKHAFSNLRKSCHAECLHLYL